MTWKPVSTTFEQLPYTLDANWIKVADSISGANKLKFCAIGEWNITNTVYPDSGPDGAPGVAVPDNELILPGAPLGALLGKIGGSSAFQSIPKRENGTEIAIPAENEPFAIGTFCVLNIPNGLAGPLFIGINTRFRPVQITNFELTVDGE